MKIVTYKLVDMQTIAKMLNAVAEEGVNLEQTKLVASIVMIIDNNNLGIQDVEEEQTDQESDKNEGSEE